MNFKEKGKIFNIGNCCLLRTLVEGKLGAIPCLVRKQNSSGSGADGVLRSIPDNGWVPCAKRVPRSLLIQPVRTAGPS